MIWKVVSPCIEESRFLVWSWWGLCKRKRCPFDHLNKKAFDWSNSGIMTRRNLKTSLRPKIMHHLDETLASSINSQHILDCKWKPIISDFQRFSVSLIPIDVLCIGQIEASTCPPGQLTFLKIIVQIPPYPGQNAVQMPHTGVHSGDQMPPPRGHFTGTKMTEGRRKRLQLSNKIFINTV